MCLIEFLVGLERNFRMKKKLSCNNGWCWWRRWVSKKTGSVANGACITVEWFEHDHHHDDHYSCWLCYVTTSITTFYYWRAVREKCQSKPWWGFKTAMTKTGDYQFRKTNAHEMVSAQTTKKKEEKCDHWGILVTHFYRDKMTDFVSWNISRNALHTLYGQKVFLLYDLVAQGTFAVIPHFFSLTSFSFFFLPMVFDTILFLTT